MAGDKQYELVPQAIPMRQRTSLYQEIVSEFNRQATESREAGLPDDLSMAVTKTERKPATLVQGLRKAIEAYTEAMDGDVAPMRVVQRAGVVYLVS